MTAAEASSFPSVFGRVAELPSSKRGVRDIKKDAAKPPLRERTGWSGTRKHFGLPDHPVCGAKEARRHFIDAAATPSVSGCGKTHEGALVGVCGRE